MARRSTVAPFHNETTLEYRPRITLAAKIGEHFADLDRRGLIADAGADDTEDQLIARVEAL